MNRPKPAAAVVVWGTLAALPAMTGSMFLLVFFLGGAGGWATPVFPTWLAAGSLTLTRRGEAIAARLFCRFRRPAPRDAATVDRVLLGVLEHCRVSRESVDLYVVNSASCNAYATGRYSIALTQRLINDYRRGDVADPELAAILCHELGHLVTRGVRLALVVAWFATPWRTAYRHGARLVAPIVARQPKILLAGVVLAAFAIAIGQGARQHEWASVTVLIALPASTLIAPMIGAASCRASEYAADQYAACAGYGYPLTQALRNLERQPDGRVQPWRTHPATDRRIQRLRPVDHPGLSCVS